MAQVITGIIQEVRSKDVSGGRKSYDIVVGGQAYGCGLYPPKAKEGDYVKFDLDESRGYKNVGRNTLRVSANKPPAEAVAAAASTAPKAGGVDQRQDSIVRQSSLNYAIMYLGVLAQAGALAVPATKGKQQEYMDTMRKKYTQEFYEANTGIAYKDISPNAGKGDESAAEDEPSAPADEQWD